MWPCVVCHCVWGCETWKLLCKQPSTIQMFDLCKNVMENVMRSGQCGLFSSIAVGSWCTAQENWKQPGCAEAGNYLWDGLGFECKCAWKTYQWDMCLDEMLTVYLPRGSCDIKEWKACWRYKLLWRIWLSFTCVVDCSEMAKKKKKSGINMNKKEFLNFNNPVS